MKRFGEKLYRQSYFETKNQFFSTDSLILSEARLIKSQSADNTYDVFISHSSKDKIIAINFRKELAIKGISSYIDWIDDSETGREDITPVLKKVMNNSRTLIYLHTHNSTNSKWTPWEIGYFDSKKSIKYIGVVPFVNDQSTTPKYDGQEYLKQYNEIGSDYLVSFIKNGIPI